MKEKSIAKKVHEWLKERPSIIYTLKKDLINFSSLSRTIQKELNIKNFDAVIAAVRRYQRDSGATQLIDKALVDLLKKSRLEIKTGVNVYTVKTDIVKNIENLEYLHVVKGSNATTIITQEKLKMDCIKSKENMVEVKIVSPPELESISGFMAYVCSALAERGISIIENYSCYTDTIFIFDKLDMTRIVEVMGSIGIK